jgi:hypothetical protein
VTGLQRSWTRLRETQKFTRSNTAEKEGTAVAEEINRSGRRIAVRRRRVSKRRALVAETARRREEEKKKKRDAGGDTTTLRETVPRG